MILAQNFHGTLRQMSTTDQCRHPYFSSYTCVLSFCHQSEYQRGVSAWNFDIEDLKAQASLVSKIVVSIYFQDIPHWNFIF